MAGVRFETMSKRGKLHLGAHLSLLTEPRKNVANR
jgi:hypothetical protein